MRYIQALRRLAVRSIAASSPWLSVFGDAYRTGRLAIGLVCSGGFPGEHREAHQDSWEHDVRSFEIATACDVLPERAEKMGDEVAASQGKRPSRYGRVGEMSGRQRGLAGVDMGRVERGELEGYQSETSGSLELQSRYTECYHRRR